MALWDDFGGEAVMAPLLRDFYARVAASQIARLFPSDLEDTFQKQFAFQSEFWGGPALYMPLRGHPRLRARHLPFPIRVEDAQEWIACMHAATAASAMAEDQRVIFLERMRQIAMAMVNTY